MNKMQHTYWLDALKFISMIVVLLCHLRMAFFHNELRTISFGNFVFPNYAFNGNLAVCIFLLISCYLFILKAKKTDFNKNQTLTITLKRYVRLGLPAIIVNFVILLLFISNIFFNVGAYETEVPYVDSWFAFSSNLQALIKMIWADVNVCLFDYNINPPLWCYYLLFWLPLISFLAIQLIENQKTKIIISLVLLPILLANRSYFAAIPLAFLISNIERINKVYGILLCTATLLGCLLINCVKINLSQYEMLSKIDVSINMLLAASILGLFCIFKERNILNYKIFSTFNKISFSIYLLHMPLICSLGFWLFRHNFSIMFICLSVFICLIMIAIPFHFYVEKKLSGWVLEKFKVK